MRSPDGKTAIINTNDAPFVQNAIAPITVDEDAANTLIDLSNVFSDVEGDAIALSIFANTNTGIVTTTLDGNNLILDYQDNQFGTAKKETTSSMAEPAWISCTVVRVPIASSSQLATAAIAFLISTLPKAIALPSADLTSHS